MPKRTSVARGNDPPPLLEEVTDRERISYNGVMGGQREPIGWSYRFGAPGVRTCCLK